MAPACAPRSGLDHLCTSGVIRTEHQGLQMETSVNAARLIRLISARSEAVARRVAQDPEGPFCPMKVGTARGFVTTDYQPLELRPNGASRATLR